MGEAALLPTVAFVPVVPAPKPVVNSYTAEHGEAPGQLVDPSLDENTKILPELESTIGAATNPVPRSTRPEAVTVPVELTR